MYSRKSQSVEVIIVRKVLKCQDYFAVNFECIHEVWRTVACYLRIPASYLRILAIDYEIAMHKKKYVHEKGVLTV